MAATAQQFQNADSSVGLPLLTILTCDKVSTRKEEIRPGKFCD